jgi:hypothetical protein
MSSIAADQHLKGQTSPMPPAPNAARSSYGPSRAPACRAICVTDYTRPAAGSVGYARAFRMTLVRLSWRAVGIGHRSVFDPRAPHASEAVILVALHPASRSRTARMILRADGSTPSAASAPPSITGAPSTNTLNSPYPPRTISTSVRSSRRSRAATRTACKPETQYEQ